MMIEKIKKYIMCSAEDKVLNIDQKDIEQYLSEVKNAVEKDKLKCYTKVVTGVANKI